MSFLVVSFLVVCEKTKTGPDTKSKENAQVESRGGLGEQMFFARNLNKCSVCSGAPPPPSLLQLLQLLLILLLPLSSTTTNTTTTTTTATTTGGEPVEC